MLTSLVLVAVVGFYGRRELRAWVRDCRCMVLVFAAALTAGRWE